MAGGSRVLPVYSYSTTIGPQSLSDRNTLHPFFFRQILNNKNKVAGVKHIQLQIHPNCLLHNPVCKCSMKIYSISFAITYKQKLEEMKNNFAHTTLFYSRFTNFQ